jgi:hypothetical protein
MKKQEGILLALAILCLAAWALLIYFHPAEDNVSASTMLPPVAPDKDAVTKGNKLDAMSSATSSHAPALIGP